MERATKSEIQNYRIQNEEWVRGLGPNHSYPNVGSRNW